MTTKKKRTPHSQNDRWVVVAADSAVETPKKDDSDPTFIRLRNPSTDAASLYLLGSGDVQLYEVKAFNEDFHSWFIGQTVQRDGRLLYVTPMDPLYLLLPYLIKAGEEGKFQPVDQVVMDEDFPACTRLLSCTRSQTSLHHVAEEKEVGSQTFQRYSQERTMEWLKKKAERTVKTLRKSNISVGEGVKSTTYVRVKQESETQEGELETQEEDYLRYAHGLISEYISEDLSKALLKHLQLPELSSPKEVEPPSKPPKKMSAAQKTLAKVDKTGMKSMSAFFSPKGKAEKK
uniref:Ribonuclease H2 subunit B n=1 Tax=Oncorhynchus tshawytscha TaxID=74940 RepID=A0A8C8EMN0_ONCTS